MLDAMEPGEFDEWLAYRKIEPDPLDRLFIILQLGFCILANAWGAKIEPHDIDPFLKQASGASSKPGESVQGQEVSPNQAAAMVKLAVGAPN